MSSYWDTLEKYRRTLSRLRQVEASGGDIISRQQAIAREATALGVEPVYDRDLDSPSYGKLIGVSWSNSWGTGWQ